MQRSIDLLQWHCPPEGYKGAFSGGKDSICIKELARLAEVPVEWHYHVTTIDPPEVVKFIRRYHPDVIFDRPKHGYMLKRALKKGVPSRNGRWCCDEYKEGKTDGFVILGVRIAESKNREKRWTKCVMTNLATKQNCILPTRLWSDLDVWSFIRSQNLPYPALYDEGFSRLGCVGCPLAGPKNRKREWKRWPKIYQAWRRTFERLWSVKKGTTDRNGNEWFGSRNFDSWQEWFEWWDDGQPNITQWKRERACDKAQGVLF